MQFAHEARIEVDAPARDVWNQWSQVDRLPQFLSHLRAIAASDCEDLARLVIVLDGRHIEFAAQQTVCTDENLCWQSLGNTFLYVLSVTVNPEREGKTSLTVNVAYDPPGFLPDIAESMGMRHTFGRTLEADLRRYAEELRGNLAAVAG